MVVVNVSEMYDMRTTKDKVGVLGIHTPSAPQIQRRWAGLMLNYKYFRVRSCSVKIACASTLPADPLQIGVDANTLIAPQDIMNPILYRACTNEGWNAVLNRVYATGGFIDNNSVKYNPNGFANLTNDQAEQLYYALLSSDEWRKALPQSGLSMSGLRPLVFPVLNAYGNIAYNNAGISNVQNVLSGTGFNIPSTADGSAGPGAAGMISTFRGHAVPMPRFPCTSAGSRIVEGDPNPVMDEAYIPKTYVACIVLPPAKLTIFYFRLLVTWQIEFQGLASTFEKEQAADIAADSMSYYRTYTFGAAKEPDNNDDHAASISSSVDVVDGSIDLIMEK